MGERSKPGVLGTQAAELLQTLAGSAFKRAEGTRFLGEGIAKLLGVSPYLDKEALASRLTGCESPEILLIATHGLFSREVQLQDCVNLILALLTCPNGQEAELLQKNRKLLDKTLLEEMEKAAAILAENENQNAADWLRNFAAQVAAIITVKQLQQSSLGLAVLKELQKLIPQDYHFCQDDKPLEHPYFWGAWVCQGDTTAISSSQIMQ
ncbi:hypothetical protein [Allocoleopsis franciscana]|uniref:Uncharacterized protein n=1 Tax=Allocoleopsis franciscana PCC 7113 TaxID=1173027 RepID=K9WJ40_9CYAN|nr:hypothetical protein [Allocoleopsis franciscana]AFZ19537.1 hypothetical protein Mic7113_3820 [Allocoleopsis franciscana PCC 7113]